MKAGVRGFTLIEVLGSLVLLALLLLGVYGGIRAATQSVRSGEAAIERLDQIRSAQLFLRREIAQAQGMAFAHTDQGENIYFLGDAHQMRFVAPLPGYLGKLGPQLQQISFESNGKGAKRLVASFAILPPDGSDPKPLGDPEVLVDNLRDGSFSYRSADSDDQPGTWGADWGDGRAMPVLVKIDLDLNGTYGWPLLEAPLRVDPTAAGNQLNLLRGLNRGQSLR
ncbi:prepilin-type N-terminal cleavage/methylation domain-containing protein [Dyella sp.]|uniref:prepilin-type N-terminal cleavage/methylation domain-containing protein n=1 Tax=Dyella sp. TaxID=1869338 RepID=UPI002ED12922